MSIRVRETARIADSVAAGLTHLAAVWDADPPTWFAHFCTIVQLSGAASDAHMPVVGAYIHQLAMRFQQLWLIEQQQPPASLQAALFGSGYVARF